MQKHVAAGRQVVSRPALQQMGRLEPAGPLLGWGLTTFAKFPVHSILKDTVVLMDLLAFGSYLRFKTIGVRIRLDKQGSWSAFK